MSETVELVVATITENRRRFEAFCYALSEDELNRAVPASTWIVRDFAAHLGTLDRAMLGWLRALASGEPSLDATRNDDGSPFDVDAFNESQVVERRDWPLDRVFAEAATNRTDLIDALRALPERASDPELRQWLDNPFVAGYQSIMNRAGV